MNKKLALLPLSQTLETKKVLKKTIQANRALAKLNGVAHIIPNQNILINSLVLQEAKDSSEIKYPSSLLSKRGLIYEQWYCKNSKSTH